MNINISSARDNVLLAFRLLKQDTYYDKMDLFLRAKIAEYEASADFQERQNRLAKVVVDFVTSPDLEQVNVDTIKEWLEQVDYRLLPKSIESLSKNNDNSPRFISNVRTSEKYEIKNNGGVQYIIDAPVELYILCTLWCMTVGSKLDKDLDESCFGNRLEPMQKSNSTNPTKLFKIFHYQYTKWRNTAIEKAEALLDQDISTVIISLDLKQCYYHLSVDWQKIQQISPSSHVSTMLTNVVKRIHDRYHEKVLESLKITHDFTLNPLEGIPIGLPSSRVLANWMLKEFDSNVQKKICPMYYGRYVDDMLIVTQAPPEAVTRQGAEGILQDVLIKNNLIKCNPENGKEYILTCLPNLAIQHSKLIIHHFDRKHSRAGLKEFMAEIKKDASDFRFLPTDEQGRELDSCAYDIIYKGSVNKFRSVIGITENSTELSKYLARRIIEHRLTSDCLSKTITKQLDRFSRGKNILDFCTTWEQVLTLLMIKGQHEEAAKILSRYQSTIKKLTFNGEGNHDIEKKAKDDLKEFLAIALALPLALLSYKPKYRLRSKRLSKLIEIDFQNVNELAVNFRKSNLLRHQWVAWPLLNYLEYTGSLVSLDEVSLKTIGNWNIDTTSEMTPRYIHEDEKQLFGLLQIMVQPTSSAYDYFFKETAGLSGEIYSSEVVVLRECGSENDHRGQPAIVNVSVHGKSEDSLSMGIGNLNVNEKDISASYEPLSIPNTTWKRQTKIFTLLNLAEKESCDMLVLPEVSIPYLWLPFMVAHARRTQTALIFGLEHWINSNTAYNLLITILPYRDKDHYHVCHMSVRPKNYYSPGELSELATLDLCPPDLTPGYFLFNWRGAKFTVFNCYELSNIRHRGLFRGKIDFMIGSEWNKDTKYFSNIVESTVRDLYCYMVQVNTSQFGDSRITAPKQSELMNLARISGGENTTLLKAELNIKEFNNLRCKKFSKIFNGFKPAPAGFEHDQIRNNHEKNCNIC